MRCHEYQDRVSLQMAREVVRRWRLSEEPLKIAQENFARWMKRNADTPTLMRCYTEWAEILTLPKEEVIAILLAETDEGQRLRQNSPFVGVMPPREVWALKNQVPEKWE